MDRDVNRELIYAKPRYDFKSKESELNAFNRLIRRTGRRLGVEIDRVRPYKYPFGQLIRLCKLNDCRLLLDIGANTGQFAQSAWNAGFVGRIVSFEPQERAHSLLVVNASRVPGWDVAERMCAGDVDCTVQLNISINSVSSSVLPVLERSTSAQPDTAYMATQEVPMRRLDGWAAEEITGYDGAIALKIDAQGFEEGVLRGAENILDRIIAIEIEMSLAPLYAGAPSFIELYSRMEAMGFVCVGLYPGFTDQETCRMFQVDGLFAREDD